MKDYPHLYQDCEIVPPRRAPASGSPHVAILMALHNGARFLSAQLDSLAAQTHDNWSLAIRDDGSSDGGLDIARAFASRHAVHHIETYRGAHLGFARCFLRLLDMADPAADAAAFCDQDDVWLPAKLARATAALREVPAEIPAIHCGPTIVADAALRQLGVSPSRPRGPSFGNALVQSIAGGNTMVMNRAALVLLRRAARVAGDIPSHDWWAYQVVTGAGGVILFDDIPMVIYRQHDGNLVGSNRGARAQVQRLGHLLAGRLADWTDRNIAALSAAAPLLTPENRDTLARFSGLRSLPALRRAAALRALGINRQTRASDAALRLAATLGKL